MGRLLFRGLRAAIIGFILAMITLVFLASPARISGTSMMPTLADRELVILLKIPHIFNLCPSYGDVVAIDSRVERNRSVLDDLIEPLQNGYARFSHSTLSRNIWIKRVIGLPGDTLVIRDGELYRNGKKSKGTLHFRNNAKRKPPTLYSAGRNRVRDGG